MAVTTRQPAPPSSNSLPPRPNKVSGVTKSYIHAMIYGKPGVGKTTLGATLPGPVLFLDCDDGLLSIQCLTKDHEVVKKFGIDIDNIYSEKIRSLNDVINVIKKLRHEFNVDKNRYGGIVLDNLTEFQRVIMSSRITNESDGTMRQPQFQDWGALLTQIQTTIRLLKNLPCHLVLLAHESSKDGFTGPALSGRISEELPGYVDFLFRYIVQNQTVTDNEGKQIIKEIRGLRCKPGDGTVAKDRSGRLNEWERPDMKTIISKMFPKENS